MYRVKGYRVYYSMGVGLKVSILLCPLQKVSTFLRYAKLYDNGYSYALHFLIACATLCTHYKIYCDCVIILLCMSSNTYWRVKS